MPLGDLNEVEDVMAHLHEPIVSALPHGVKNNLSPWTCHHGHVTPADTQLPSLLRVLMDIDTLSLGGGSQGTFLIFKIYLFFIFGCTGSVAVSGLSLVGAWFSHCSGFSCCKAQALENVVFSSRDAQA